jgi:hypothetical protein
VLLGHVIGQFEHDGPGAPSAQRRKGLPHAVRDLAGAEDLFAEFRDAPVVPHAIEIRGHADVGPIRMARQEQNGAGVSAGLDDAGKGILRASALLDQHDTYPPPVGHPRNAVGHVAGHALLAGDDGPDALLGEAVDHRVLRITGDELDAFELQDSGDRCGTVHGS